MAACVVVAASLALPVIGASAAIELRVGLAAAADSAALAAADSAAGFAGGAPCELAERVAQTRAAKVISCGIDGSFGARVVLGADTPLGQVVARARAGPDPALVEMLGAGDPPGRWVWPSSQRGITQGHHLGFAIDLAVAPGGPLLSPRGGIIVSAGADGGGMPAACREHPDWWRGPNHTVIVRHEDAGRVIFSSHNHIEPGSVERLGLGVGSRVRAGQQVAAAGMSGCTSGPHTHFTMSTRPSNAVADVDPLPLIGSP